MPRREREGRLTYKPSGPPHGTSADNLSPALSFPLESVKQLNIFIPNKVSYSERVRTFLMSKLDFLF